MALHFRRVVTGHDETGRAVVKIDEIAQNLVSSRPGASKIDPPQRPPAPGGKEAQASRLRAIWEIWISSVPA